MTGRDLQRDITKLFETHGFLVIRHNAGYVRKNVRLSPVGMTDLEAIGPHSRVVFVEVKGDGDTLRESQIAMHERLKKMGHRVVVARSIDDIIAVIKE